MAIGSPYSVPFDGRLHSPIYTLFGFLHEILCARPLVVEPGPHGDPVAHIRDQHAVAVFRRVEQLILLGLLRHCRFLLLLLAQGDEAVGLPPAFRLISELALAVGIGFGRTRPLGGFQFIDQTRGLARRDNELHACLFVGLDRFGAVKTGIGSRLHRLHTLRQGRKHVFQMTRDLGARWPIPIPQLSSNVFPGFGQKRQNR
jgi:hypothetical protein